VLGWTSTGSAITTLSGIESSVCASMAPTLSA
jgi:hypothetical protein